MTRGTLYSPSPPPTRRAPRGAHVLVAAFPSIGLSTTSAKAQAGEVKARFDLTATPRVIDEGKLVEFGMENLAYFDSETGETLDFGVSASEVDWNFEDGSGGERGNGMLWVNHRFIDDRLSAYTVRARYGGGQGSIDIRVNNVPPEIRSLWHSRPAIQGKDPGTSAVSNSSASPPATSSSECSCACDQRAFADELCELFCGEEFAACDNQ